MAKNSKDIERLEQDIASLESDLASSGSTKTADDVQKELDDVTAELCVPLRFASCFQDNVNNTCFVQPDK